MGGRVEARGESCVGVGSRRSIGDGEGGVGGR